MSGVCGVAHWSPVTRMDLEASVAGSLPFTIHAVAGAGHHPLGESSAAALAALDAPFGSRLGGVTGRVSWSLASAVLTAW